MGQRPCAPENIAAPSRASGGTEALGKVRAAQGRFDAVILDDVLQDFAGEALASELRALHDQLALVITARERADALRERFSGDRCTIVIARPYSGAQLQEALERLAIECNSVAGGKA